MAGRLLPVAGRIQLLLDRLSGDEPACRDLSLTQRSAQRAAELWKSIGGACRLD